MSSKKVQPPQEAVVALLDAAHKQLAAETREEIARIEQREMSTLSKVSKSGGAL
jgi:hypothetical protein